MLEKLRDGLMAKYEKNFNLSRERLKILISSIDKKGSNIRKDNLPF